MLSFLKVSRTNQQMRMGAVPKLWFRMQPLYLMKEDVCSNNENGSAYTVALTISLIL